MTDQEIHDAIAADVTAMALADAGNDVGCAERLRMSLPREIRPTLITERGVYAAFPDPAAAYAVMEGLKAVALGNPGAVPPIPPNPSFARVLGWMDPSQGGVDVGNPTVRGMLDQLEAGGVIAPVANETIKKLAESPASVSTDDVSRAWSRYRPEGLVGGNP